MLNEMACRRLAEAGCTVHEIASISGHATLRKSSATPKPPISSGSRRRRWRGQWRQRRNRAGHGSIMHRLKEPPSGGTLRQWEVVGMSWATWYRHGKPTEKPQPKMTQKDMAGILGCSVRTVQRDRAAFIAGLARMSQRATASKTQFNWRRPMPASQRPPSGAIVRRGDGAREAQASCRK